MNVPRKLLSVNLSAYRIRFIETELPQDKRINISEYGYNPNPNNINRLRFNLPREQVLYTSTNPWVSYCETVSEKSHIPYLYLSVWRKKHQNKKTSCFLSSLEHCSQNKDSNAYKIRQEYCQSLTDSELKQVLKISRILEKEYDPNEKDIYKESSKLASKMFKKIDCIISPCAKENDEVNLTYSKQYADNSLSLSHVFFCRSFEHRKKSLGFKVEKIGIRNENKVIWYNWRIIEDSIKPIEPSQAENDMLYPNVNQPVNGWHTGIYQKQKVKFKIELLSD